MKIALLIVAAGSSSRLGSPKQLVPFGKSNLLSHTIEVCNRFRRETKGSVGFSRETETSASVILILGAYHELIRKNIESDNCRIFINPNWQQGMGRSIGFGIEQITHERFDAAIVIVGDQPHFRKENLNYLVTAHQEAPEAIIISKYDNGAGPPTLFPKKYFSELAQLDGDDGAKSVIKKHWECVKQVDFPKGDIDIDTQKDLNSFFPQDEEEHG